MVTKFILKVLYKMQEDWRKSINHNHLVWELSTYSGFELWLKNQTFCNYFFSWLILYSLEKDVLPEDKNDPFIVYMYIGKPALQNLFDHLNRTIARLERKIN
jgi:hypothetical protein